MESIPRRMLSRGDSRDTKLACSALQCNEREPSLSLDSVWDSDGTPAAGRPQRWQESAMPDLKPAPAAFHHCLVLTCLAGTRHMAAGEGMRDERVEKRTGYVACGRHACIHPYPSGSWELDSLHVPRLYARATWSICVAVRDMYGARIVSKRALIYRLPRA